MKRLARSASFAGAAALLVLLSSCHLPRLGPPEAEVTTRELETRLAAATSGDPARAAESLAALDAIVADAPHWFRARRARQDAVVAARGKDAAVAEARAAVAKDGDTASHVLLARLLDGDAAREELDRALALDPNFHWARWANGCLRARAGEMEDAEAEFSAALDRWPDFIEARLSRARVRDQLADFEGARDDYSAYLVARPGDRDARYALASILHRELDRPDAAEEHYRLLLDQDPSFAPAAIGLAVRLTEQRDYEGAERLYRSVYSDPLAKFNLGQLYLDQMGKYPQAEQCFVEFLADAGSRAGAPNTGDDTLIADRLLYAPLRLQEVRRKLESDRARRSGAGP